MFASDWQWYFVAMKFFPVDDRDGFDDGVADDTSNRLAVLIAAE